MRVLLSKIGSFRSVMTTFFIIRVVYRSPTCFACTVFYMIRFNQLESGSSTRVIRTGFENIIAMFLYTYTPFGVTNATVLILKDTLKFEESGTLANPAPVKHGGATPTTARNRRYTYYYGTRTLLVII